MTYRLYGVPDDVADCSDRFLDFDTLSAAISARGDWVAKGWDTAIFKRDKDGNEEEVA